MPFPFLFVHRSHRLLPFPPRLLHNRRSPRSSNGTDSNPFPTLQGRSPNHRHADRSRRMVVRGSSHGRDRDRQRVEFESHCSWIRFWDWIRYVWACASSSFLGLLSFESRSLISPSISRLFLSGSAWPSLALKPTNTLLAQSLLDLSLLPQPSPSLRQQLSLSQPQQPTNLRLKSCLELFLLRQR